MSRWYDEIRSDAQSRGLPDPYAAFGVHRAGAAKRGIAFNFTFLEWWAVWEPYWHQRGLGSSRMCMCRVGDKGAYEPGNVRIDTHRANISEFWAENYPERREEVLARRRANCYEKAAQKWLDEVSSSGI